MVAARQILAEGEEILRRMDVEDHKHNARELLAKVLEIKEISQLAFELDEPVGEQAREEFLGLCERRGRGEPLQYILGEWEFFGLTLKVGEGVLIPRQDSEVLIETAIKKWGSLKDITVTDLCAGSGCLALAAAKNLSCKRVCCVENSHRAAEYLKENAKLNQVEMEVFLEDVLRQETVNKLPKADLILCNPPYLTKKDMENLQREVTYEPFEALFGGEDGMDFYRVIVRLWKNRLKQGGVMMFEVSPFLNEEVMQLMIQHGFSNVRSVKDSCGLERCVYGCYFK